MEIILIILIATGTFITRIINLLNIPIFTDEAIYIRWAQIGLSDPSHRYIALTDGKQPLLTWLMYPWLKVFSDPLMAGRFVSVLSGVTAVIGLYFVARNLFGRKTALISSVLYIFSPFFLLYDRLALMDSLLTAIGIWSLYLEILLIKYLRLDTALILGIVIGLGLLTKTSAFFYLYLIPFGLIIFDFKIKSKWRRIGKYFGLSAVSFIIAQIIYNSLRLSPWFYIIRLKNYSFIYTIGEFLQDPFAVFLPNINGLSGFLVTYLTLPLTSVLILTIILAIVKKERKLIYLFFWFIFPFLALSAFGKVLFPRFLLFMVPPLLIMIAWTFGKFTYYALKNAKIIILIIPLLFAYPIYQSSLLLFSPVYASIPPTDRNQLFDDWPSGWGVKEVIDYLTQKSKYEKIVVGTEGTFGLNPAVLEIYLGLNKNIEIYGYWPVNEVPRDLVEKAMEYPTYLMFKEKQNIPSNWPLTLIAKYRRGLGNTYLYFYQVQSVKT